MQFFYVNEGKFLSEEVNFFDFPALRAGKSSLIFQCAGYKSFHSTLCGIKYTWSALTSLYVTPRCVPSKAAAQAAPWRWP